jgi:hypothetical protein
MQSIAVFMYVVLVTLLQGVAYSALARGGDKELFALIVWTLPFAGICSSVLRTQVSKKIPFALLPLLGALCAFVYGLLANLITGGWMGAFSSPLGLYWVLAGLSVPFVNVELKRYTRRAILALACTVAVSLVSAHLLMEFYSESSLIIIRHNPGQQELRWVNNVSLQDDDGVLADQVRLDLTSRLKGDLDWKWELERGGLKKPIVVVLSGPLSREIELDAPNRRVVYFQRDGKWYQIPESDSHARTATLSPADSGTGIVYHLRDRDGSEVSGYIDTSGWFSD